MCRKSVVCGAVVVAALVLLAAGSVTGNELRRADSERTASAPSLEAFDADVAQCRRKLRLYCALAQDLMSRPENPQDRQAQALVYLREASKQWQAVFRKYQDAPPMPYRGDRQWKARLADIHHAFEDMEIHLAAGRAKRSFQACGFACGLFVSMHEENNLVYALDRLFHLRKLTKTAMAAVAAGGDEAIAPFLPDLMQLRDRVLLAPCPWPHEPPLCDAYLAALRKLSTSVDDLAIAGRRSDNVAASLSRCMAAIQEVYGNAL